MHWSNKKGKAHTVYPHSHNYNVFTDVYAFLLATCQEGRGGGVHTGLNSHESLHAS